MISVQTFSSKPLYARTTPGYTFATPYDYPKSPIPVSIDSQFTPATNSSSILPLASSKQMETLMYCRQDQNGAFHEDISLWICGRQVSRWNETSRFNGESKTKNAVDTGGRPTDYFQGCISRVRRWMYLANLSGWFVLRLHRLKASRADLLPSAGVHAA